MVGGTELSISMSLRSCSLVVHSVDPHPNVYKAVEVHSYYA